MNFAKPLKISPYGSTLASKLSSFDKCTGPGAEANRDFEFRGQLTSAALSVMNNIAEGFERKTRKDFARFLDQAKCSCGEVRRMPYAAEDLNYLAVQKAQTFREKAARLSAGIETLAKHLRR